MRAKGLIAVLGLALLATCLAAALACGGRAVAPSDAAASQPATGTSGTAQTSAAPKEEAAEEKLRVVRWVCTDRLCGGCDGQCSNHGHVATQKGGHCACTPKEGGALDQATRKAFEGREKKK
jgi:hypothetical protein